MAPSNEGSIYLGLSLFLLVSVPRAHAACEVWCDNACTELTGNVAFECDSCDASVLCHPAVFPDGGAARVAVDAVGETTRPSSASSAPSSASSARQQRPRGASFPVPDNIDAFDGPPRSDDPNCVDSTGEQIKAAARDEPLLRALPSCRIVKMMQLCDTEIGRRTCPLRCAACGDVAEPKG